MSMNLTEIQDNLIGAWTGNIYLLCAFCALLCAFCGEMRLLSIQSISMPNASGARGMNVERV